MNREKVLRRVREIRLMPLFYHDDPDVAAEVMKAVYEGGLELLEFTNRGSSAMRVFEKLIRYKSDRYPGALLGIGSVVDASTSLEYIRAGADFVVAPLLNRELIEACREKDVLHIPGCSTLTEIHQAGLWGAEMVKVFPAAQLGGPAYIRAIKSPCPWLSLVVTGGVKATAEDLKAWHEAGAEGFGLGSDLISKELIMKGNFEGLSKKVRELVGFVKSLKN
jgi:2-dehydro-3-deoxyphosphogluconate aldolase/(4S)-4-hydroxy-2-oxoglutarate aldolase